MILHVLPGDSLAEEFRKTAIDGEVTICRECLIVGDMDAETLPEFWEQRARFILSEYGEDEIEYHENVADDLAELIDLPLGAQVNLWFEYELFCGVNMWFCLDLLRNTAAEVYRVEPNVRTSDDIWKGFGSLDADALKSCFAARKQFTPDDIKLGSDLWNAWKTKDRSKLKSLGETESKCFPYLKEVCEAAVEIEKRPREILEEIAKDKNDFTDIFAEFSKRAGVYGFGDLQVEKLLERL